MTGVAIGVQGAGAIDTIVAWQTITRPRPLLEPVDALGARDQILGRLDSLIMQAEAECPPTLGAEAMH